MRAERLRIEGIVQGVGFRPFVWHLAQEFGLLGRVWNHSQGVSIEIWGAQEVFDRFAAALRERAPAHARIDAIQRQDLAVPGPAPAEFVIAASEAGEVRTEPLADLASCPDCVREVLDPADRRFGYALSNCTHCGPRLSIVERLPYDRENTTMARFAMCADCACEYADPADRRFHAQPIACAKCGPQVRLVVGQGREISGEAIAGAAQRIRGGQIVAIKGLGGYHLCCDARQAEAVERLRERKHRPRKPLAVMARDLDVVRRFARLNEEESRLLCAPAAPIVLLHAAGEPLPETVAPGQHTLGFLLPYTPLHHLLLREFDGPLVMTSGNLSEEPQVTEDGEARARLGSIADAFLVHDRPIHNRVDDSVVQFAAGATRVLRRARGLAPQSLPLPPGFQGDQMGLAMGAELKASFCLARAGRLVLSQHMGDLSEPTALADYLRHLDLYLRLNDCGPQWIAVDGHPDAHSRLAGRACIRLGSPGSRGPASPCPHRRRARGAWLAARRGASARHRARWNGVGRRWGPLGRGVPCGGLSAGHAGRLPGSFGFAGGHPSDSAALAHNARGVAARRFAAAGAGDRLRCVPRDAECARVAWNVAVGAELSGDEFGRSLAGWGCRRARHCATTRAI
ncbi:MAG: carbamoyltransferase HypF [Planctomycetota bacterium]